MAKYYVCVKAVASDEFEIEAENQDEAEREAFDQMGYEFGGEFSLEIEDSYCINEEEDDE